MIVAAALLVNGEVWTLPKPTRHHTLIQAWCQAHYTNGANAQIPNDHQQGFVDHLGRFVSRQNAARVAFRHGQVDQLKAQLFSEDLW